MYKPSFHFTKVKGHLSVRESFLIQILCITSDICWHVITLIEIHHQVYVLVNRYSLMYSLRGGHLILRQTNYIYDWPEWHTTYRPFCNKVSKWTIANCNNYPQHYKNSRAIWNHMWQKWHSRLYHNQLGLVPDLATPDRCKAVFT